MTIFYVVSNDLYTTVVSSDSEADDGADDVSEDQALELAIARFEKAGLNPFGLVVKKAIDDEEASSEGFGDDPSDMGLADAVFIRAAEMLTDEDHCVDGDAIVSGFNVRTWSWVDPNDALHRLAEKAEVVANSREVSMHEALEVARSNAGWSAVAAFHAFQANADSASLLTLVAAMKDLDNALKAEDRPKAALSSVIQTWEVSGSPDELAELSDEQRKPWKVEVEQVSANQVTVAVWPANQDMKDATSGLGLYVEIDKGVPTVHVAPAPHLENSCHIRQVSNHEVRVTPGTNLPARDDEVGKEPAYVFSNGSPQD